MQGTDPSTHSEDGHPFDRRSNVDGTRQAPSLERETPNSKASDHARLAEIDPYREGEN